jgi:hypothetical protein
MVNNVLDPPVDSVRHADTLQRTETRPPPLPDRRHEKDEPSRRISSRPNTSTWVLPVAISGGVLLYLFFVAAVMAVVAMAYFTMSNQIDILGR